MRVYHQRWRFRHPTSRDFEQAANEVSGRDLKWFFDQFVFGNRLLDYQVGSVVNLRISTPIGLFEKNGKLEAVTPDQAEAADEKLDKDKNYKPQYECTVKIRRLGDAQVPIDVLIHFTDGTTERRQWDGQYRWEKYTFLRNSVIDWVQVDPERKYLLDVNFANNSWQKGYNVQLGTHWTANLLFWLQNVMLTLTTLA